MSILFVLLTFLIVITVTYFLRHEQPAMAVHAEAFQPTAPFLSQTSDAPKGYCFHPGHTWAVDEGRQNARIGLDSFGAHLIGKVDRVEVVGMNRWVRQGQKICTAYTDGVAVDLLSPVEGVITSVNPELAANPGVLLNDPYREGWICVVKSPEMTTNLNNLLRSTLIEPWMQDSTRRLSALTGKLAPAAAADGGLPVAGLIAHLAPDAQRTMIHEFFLT